LLALFQEHCRVLILAEVVTKTTYLVTVLSGLKITLSFSAYLSSHFPAHLDFSTSAHGSRNLDKVAIEGHNTVTFGAVGDAIGLKIKAEPFISGEGLDATGRSDFKPVHNDDKLLNNLTLNQPARYCLPRACLVDNDSKPFGDFHLEGGSSRPDEEPPRVPGNHCRAYRPTCNIETKLKVITDGIEIDNEDKSVASLSGSIGSGYKLSIAIKSRTKAKEKREIFGNLKFLYV